MSIYLGTFKSRSHCYVHQIKQMRCHTITLTLKKYTVLFRHWKIYTMVVVSRLVPRCNEKFDWMTWFRNRIPMNSCSHWNNKVSISTDSQETGLFSPTVKKFCNEWPRCCGWFSMAITEGSRVISPDHTRTSNTHSWKVKKHISMMHEHAYHTVLLMHLCTS